MAVLVLVGLGVGCNLFTPREPPEPCDPTDPDCQPPAEFKEPLVPEFVRDNIKAALERPTIDPNYRDSLSDVGASPGSLGFFYIPDALAEAAATPGFFQGWNKEREVQFMLNLLESGSDPGAIPACADGDSVLVSTAAEMVFRRYEDTGQLTGTNEARYEVEYEFTLTLTFACEECPPCEGECDPCEDVSTSEVQERYCGRAFWDLEGGDRNFWTLKQWEDLEPLPSPTAPCDGTMGLLRALSGQGN